jgi:hypothetical protein
MKRNKLNKLFKKSVSKFEYKLIFLNILVKTRQAKFWMSLNWRGKKYEKKKKTLAPISNNLIIGHIHSHRERRRGEGIGKS